MGDLKTEVTLEAAADPNPEKMVIEPRDAELGPGTDRPAETHRHL